MYPPLFYLLSFSLFFSIQLSSSTTSNNRRTLHEPFFPLDSTPPSSSPTPPTSLSNPSPFFPSIPSTPPSVPSSSSFPSAQQPTFPANVSSLTFPNSNSAPSHHSNTKIVPAIVLPILTLSVLALSIAFFFNHRKRNGSGPRPAPDRSESHRLFPPGSALSDSEKPPPVSNSNPHSSEFLYLGTLVDSRTRHAEDPDLQFGSPYRKLGSPELHPLPPLSRQCLYNADVAITSPSSSEEEFYSPRGSSTEKTNSSSRRTIPTITVRVEKLEKCASQSSTLSTPSYPSSNFPSPAASSPPILSSPNHSSRRSFKMGTATALKATPPPPPPLPLFPGLRPLTPSPPKRKPHSPSPPSSPVEKDSDLNSRNSNSSNSVSGHLNLRISDYAGSPAPMHAPPAPPPPPPPPPPPVGYWESQVRKPENNRGVSVSLKKAVELKSVGTKEEMDSSGKSEETTPVKLKPLHWDKVRASSDRAMVWDQLRSSSFQLSLIIPFFCLQ